MAFVTEGQSMPKSDGDDVLGRGAFGTLDDVELDAGSLGESLETLGLDRAVMNEAILAAVLRRDESETLLIVEPLYSSCSTHYALQLLCESELRDTYFTDCLLRGNLSTRCVADLATKEKRRPQDRDLRPHLILFALLRAYE